MHAKTPAQLPRKASSASAACGSPLVVNTGIAHRGVGVGEVGAGITRAPLDCFTKALTALAAFRLAVEGS
jgi:hypothetical protein